MKIYIQIIAIMGFFISVYAMVIRHKIFKVQSYTPHCDLSEKISCSKALGSKYSKTFGIPNPVAGSLFYLLVLILSFLFPSLLLYPIIASIFFTLYLAYISYIIQKNFCLVCTVTYILNIWLFILTLLDL